MQMEEAFLHNTFAGKLWREIFAGNFTEYFGGKIHRKLGRESFDEKT